MKICRFKLKDIIYPYNKDFSWEESWIIGWLRGLLFVGFFLSLMFLLYILFPSIRAN